MHELPPTFVPTAKMNTVSRFVCKVSSSVHWSSWASTLAPVAVRLKTRRPVESENPKDEPKVPNTPGAELYSFWNDILLSSLDTDAIRPIVSKPSPSTHPTEMPVLKAKYPSVSGDDIV